MVSVNPFTSGGEDHGPSGPSVAPGPGVSVGTIELGARIRNGNLDFTMRDIEGNYVRFNEQTRERYLAITTKTRLIIRLSDVINWTFDTDAGPIRLKKEGSAPFYSVSHDGSDPREIVLEVIPTGIEPDAAGEAEVHPFNIYLKINQNLGSPWPIRLDPVVKNPPTVGG
jgi:hypothetical protein